jgi:uncharacterized protein YqgQ
MADNKQQTAVDFIFDELASKNLLGIFTYEQFKQIEEILNQAKEMEKNQMIDFALGCQEMFKHQIIEKFNETYGGNK